MGRVLVVAAYAAALGLPCAASAATVTVATAAQLDAALKNAAGGDIIKVAPGNYGNVAIRNMNYASRVTVIASDSSKKPIFSHLDVMDSSNLQLTRLVVDSPAPAVPNAALNAANIWRSHDVRMSSMVFRGVSGGGVSNEARGLRISHSINIGVATSSFNELSNGITTDDSSRLTITDNAFSGIRVNGVISDGATNSVILRNRFSQFRPEAGDHPDAIQIVGAVNATNSLKINDNLVVGDAGGQMQGIFISNDGGNRALLDRIDVTNNLLWGTIWNGIAAFDANRISVMGNRVFSNPDLEIKKAWVRLENITNGVVTDNLAAAFLFTGVDTLTSTANQAYLGDSGALVALNLWDATHAASRALLPYYDSTNSDLDLDIANFNGRQTQAAVPEPASWLSLVAGFGFLGAVLRGRPRLLAGHKGGR